MKALTVIFVVLALAVTAAEFRVSIPASENDALEPSVRNEVDHAVSLGCRWLETVAATNDAALAARAAVALDSLTNSAAVPPDASALPFPTGALSRVAAALRLVRTQRAAGHWEDPLTNRADEVSVTAAALGLLQSL